MGERRGGGASEGVGGGVGGGGGAAPCEGACQMEGEGLLG